MSPTPVTAEDLYLYAMHLLDEQEEARLRDFLRQSPEAEAELRLVQNDLALFALGAEQNEPPATARQRLMNQVAREPRTEQAAAGNAARSRSDARVMDGTPAATYTPAEETVLPRRAVYDEDPPRRSFFSTLLPWAGWAVAAGLAVSTWTLYQRQHDMQDQVTFARAAAERAKVNSARAQAVLETLRSQSAQRFVLTRQSTQPVPSAHVTYLASNGSLVFEGNNMEALPADKTYELWLIPKGEGAKPIPAGTFKPDGRGYASVLLPQLPKGVEAATFGVTMEDDGGSQTPTLPILMIGA